MISRVHVPYLQQTILPSETTKAWRIKLHNTQEDRDILSTFIQHDSP